MKSVRLFLHSLLFGASILAPSTAMAQVDQGMPVLSPGTVANTAKISWLGVSGRVYFIQASTDLQTWSYAPLVEFGTGANIAWQFSTTGGRTYIRLKYTESSDNLAGASGDLDRDGLTNLEEVATRFTDPFNADTDADGMLDGWEVQYSFNPRSGADAATDFDGDGLSNLIEYGIGTHPKQTDTDGDGLNDNVEAASGDPLRFNMPEFTVVSASRDAILSENIERPAGAAVTHIASCTATGQGTSAGTYSSRTYNLPSPSTSTTFSPWSLNSAANSAWSVGSGIPAPLLPVTSHDVTIPLFASRKEKMHGDGDFIAVPGQTNAEEYRYIKRDATILERTVSIKASRPMPVAWSVPFTRSVISKSFRNGQWSAPTVSTGSFIFSAGQTFSNAIILNAASTGATGGTVSGKPGRTRSNATAPWNPSLFTSAEAVEWLTLGKIDPTTTNPATDTDRDGVSNTLEVKMGTNSTMRNSDASGYADGDQLNQKLLPPVESLIISTRRAEYEFNPEDPECPYHPAHRLATETDSPYQTDVDDNMASPTGLGDAFHLRLAAGAPFSASPPTGPAIPLLNDDGTGVKTSLPLSRMGYTSKPAEATEAADGEQVQVWASIPEPLSSPITLKYLKVRKVQASGQPLNVTSTPAPLVIPAGSLTSSTAVTLLSKRSPGDTGQETEVTEYLIFAGLRMMHPATGALGEDKENTGDGGYVPIKRDTSTPVTRLQIYNLELDANASGKVRLKFDAGDRYKLYKDAARTIPVISEVTEFNAYDFNEPAQALSGKTLHLYFEGLKKCLTRGGEKITAQLYGHPNLGWHDADDLIFTVLQSEFLFQIKAFIPYAWTEAEEVPGPDQFLNPMYGKVAKGDLHPGMGLRGISPGFRNVYSTKLPAGEFSKAPFRVCQTVIITPYPELHSAVDVTKKRELVTAPLSEHYFKTAVHASEASLQMGFLALDPAGFNRDGPPPKNQDLYENASRSGGITELTVDGGGKDGAMPTGTTWASRDIHWRLYLKVKTNADPLKPEVEFGGQHDRYPAYEIIVNQSDGTFTDIHRFSPAPGERPGLNSLYDGAGPHVSGTKIITQ